MNNQKPFFTTFLVNTLTEFTNIECESTDKDFSNFEYCRLKSANRTYKYISLKLNLFKVPVTNVKINVALYKRLNGYKPFLYNITLDACRFYKNQNSNPVALFFYNFFKEQSNMNHSCPYNHDIVVDKISTEFVNHRMTNVLPFPEGRYMLKMQWMVYDITRVVFKVYVTFS
ncbi:uncharacterized protein [Drosophila takahashii]|uniref:uncharacterized protein n=1 Tax=Drosophila takahashii TaxID=29030 RepID=UPI0038991DE8